MTRDRYYHQAKLIRDFFIKYQEVAHGDERSLPIDTVIKIWGAVLKVDLVFLAKVIELKERGKKIWSINPDQDLIFEKKATKKKPEDYQWLRGKGLEEFICPTQGHYKYKSGDENIPPSLDSKGVVRYMASNPLKILSIKDDNELPELWYEQCCLIFAWKEDYSETEISEGEYYSSELIRFISEMAAYIINNIKYRIELSDLSQASGPLRFYLIADEKAARSQSIQRRKGRSYLASNWTVMDLLDKKPGYKAAFSLFINRYSDQKDIITCAGVLRAYVWFTWLEEKEGSDQEKKLKQQKDARQQDAKIDEQMLKEQVIKRYNAVMNIPTRQWYRKTTDA